MGFSLDIDYTDMHVSMNHHISQPVWIRKVIHIRKYIKSFWASLWFINRVPFLFSLHSVSSVTSDKSECEFWFREMFAIRVPVFEMDSIKFRLYASYLSLKHIGRVRWWYVKWKGKSYATRHRKLSVNWTKMYLSSVLFVTNMSWHFD